MIRFGLDNNREFEIRDQNELQQLLKPKKYVSLDHLF